ncbi:hypothetical protein D3C86_1894460 [compost metagenome]
MGASSPATAGEPVEGCDQLKAVAIIKAMKSNKKRPLGKRSIMTLDPQGTDIQPQNRSPEDIPANRIEEFWRGAETN